MSAGTGPVVRGMSVRAVVVPMRRPLATRVGAFTHWPLLLIDVTTDTGVTGRGYIGPYTTRSASALLPALAGLGEALYGEPAAPATAWLRARGWHLYPEVSGHLMRVTPSAHWLEWQDWAHPVLARPFGIRSGELLLPDVPGNGLEWDEDAVRHYQVAG